MFQLWLHGESLGMVFATPPHMISLLLLMLSWGLTWQASKINFDRTAVPRIGDPNRLREGANWGFLAGMGALLSIDRAAEVAFLGPIIGWGGAFSVDLHRSEQRSLRQRQERLMAFRVFVCLVRGGMDLSTALMRLKLISNPTLGVARQLEEQIHRETEPLIASIWRLLQLSHERHFALLDATERAVHLAARFDLLHQGIRELRRSIVFQTIVACIFPWGVAGVLWWSHGNSLQIQGGHLLWQLCPLLGLCLIQIIGSVLALKAVRFF